MTNKLKEKIQKELLNTSLNLLKDYTNTALLINSISVARERYTNADEKIILSTTSNIPKNHRLELDLDIQFNKTELIEKYSKETIEIVIKSYVVNSVSLVDFALEAIYGYMLEEQELELSDTEVLKKIRSSWSNDNLINYFISTTGIQDDNDGKCRLLQAFQNYKEYRIIRHSLVHSNGKLEDKHIDQIDIMYNNSDESRKQKSIKNSPMYNDREIILDMNTLLGSRKFLWLFVQYFYNAIKNYC